MNTREIGLITSVMGLILIASLLAALAFAGWKLTPKASRSRLGNAVGNVCGSLASILTIFSAFFIMRLHAGKGAPLRPEWLYGALLVALIVSIIWCVVSVLIAFPELLARFHEDGDTS